MTFAPVTSSTKPARGQFGSIDLRPRSHRLRDAIRNAISIGGDSDTVGAIAGGCGRAHPASEDIAGDAWRRLPDDMRTMLTELYARAGSVPMPWTESDD